MSQDAEEKGLLKPGGVIVEGTAGNTGIGLALVANAKGYKTVIVIPQTQSQVGQNLIIFSSFSCPWWLVLVKVSLTLSWLIVFQGVLLRVLFQCSSYVDALFAHILIISLWYCLQNCTKEMLAMY